MRSISQRELRNQSGEVMRAVAKGESFVVTRNGQPVAELHPVARSRFVPTEVLIASLGGASTIDAERFRKDVDEVLEQTSDVRA